MLLAALKQVPDFRHKRGQSYRLWSLLALVLVGFLCGRRGLRAVLRMGRSLPLKQRLQLGFGRNRMPCHSTLTETLRAVDADGLADLFGRAIVRDEAASKASRHIAIDGKTPRGSKDENGDAEHCLSAFAHALDKVLDHTASRGKGRELPMRWRCWGASI
jgi:hypothetical protein